MDLKNMEVKYLKLYKKHDLKAPTVAELIESNIKIYAIMASFFGVLILISVLMKFFLSVFLIVGVLIGILARDIGVFRKSVMLWPVTKEITNWNKVDELISMKDV